MFGASKRCPKNLLLRQRVFCYTKTMNKHTEELDRVFSIYQRLKYASHEGYVSCYTCGARITWQEAQCGHFIRRGHTSVRFDINNSRSQCYECNMARNGMPEAFEENLRAEIGDKEVDDLIQMGRKEASFTDEWYVDKIRFYKRQIRGLGVTI